MLPSGAIKLPPFIQIKGNAVNWVPWSREHNPVPLALPIWALLCQGLRDLKEIIPRLGRPQSLLLKENRPDVEDIAGAKIGNQVTSAIPCKKSSRYEILPSDPRDDVIEGLHEPSSHEFISLMRPRKLNAQRVPCRRRRKGPPGDLIGGDVHEGNLDIRMELLIISNGLLRQIDALRVGLCR